MSRGSTLHLMRSHSFSTPGLSFLCRVGGYLIKVGGQSRQFVFSFTRATYDW